MIKKLTIVFLILFIGIAVYLTIPFPALDPEFPPQEPISLIPNQQNKGERCRANTIYVTQKSKKYHEDEGYEFIVNDYCANLQKDLVNAISSQNIDQVRALIAQGANPNITDFSTYQWNYPIITASYHKDSSIMKVLIDNGADVNKEYCCCASCRTPLSNAVQYNHHQVVRLLLERGADAGYRQRYEDSWTYSIIDIAIANNNSEMVKFLASNGCQNSVSCRAEFRAKRVWYFLKTIFI